MNNIQNLIDIVINRERNRNNREIENNNNEITIHVTLPNKIIRLKSYYIGKFLGKGVNSECYEFISDEDIVRHSYACKIINKNKFKENKNEIEKIDKEIQIHKTLFNRNIVKLIENFEDKKNIYILTEFCVYKTLEDLIQRRIKLTEFEVQYYIIQLIKALNYLKDQKIIHRDLQLSNIFLADNLELKLGDFSNATKISENEKLYEICGNPNYMAPEMIDGEKGYSYQVDIWSLGIILYKLIIGKFPFESNNKEELFNKIKNEQIKFPEDSIISEDAKDLINEILVKNPEERPSLFQILSHDFFSQLKIMPKSLSILFLYEAPSQSYIKKYIPNIGKKLIVEKPFNPIKTYILKWVDFSSNYGVGYILNNGFYGALFNDKSSIILSQKEKLFFYKEKDEKKQIKYNLDNYPQELKEKIYTMKIFKKYLNMGKPKIHEKIIKKNYTVTYINNFVMEEEATIFEYSNQDTHFFFFDNTEIIISKKSNILLYINQKQEKYVYPFLNASELFDKEIINIIKSYYK